MTKERLRTYCAIKAEMEQLQELLEEIEGPMTSPKVPQMTGMPGASTTVSGSAQERMADKTMALRDRYKAKIQELHAEQLAIEHAIDSLGPNMRKLLRCRYIKGMTWEDVCVQMHYSWRQTHRVHAAALRLLQDVEGDENDL